MRYRRKKQTKKVWSVLSCWREWDMHRAEKCEKQIHTKYTELEITEFIEFGSG